MGILSIRLEDALHKKLRMIAAYEETSMNSIIDKALKVEIANWEVAHGVLPVKPDAASRSAEEKTAQ